MESKAQVENEGQYKLEDMDFGLDDQLLKVQKSNSELDQELLQIQRRKSTPKVVIEEFVQVDSDKEDEKDKEEHKEDDDRLMCDNENCQVNTRPHKILKHIEIEDVSQSIVLLILTLVLDSSRR